MAFFWVSMTFGNLYYDVSKKRSASFVVTEFGLRGCWSGWKSVCIVKLEGTWQITDFGMQKDGVSNDPIRRCFNRINTTFRRLPVSETSCWCNEPVTNGKKVLRNILDRTYTKYCQKLVWFVNVQNHHQWKLTGGTSSSRALLPHLACVFSH